MNSYFIEKMLSSNLNVYCTLYSTICSEYIFYRMICVGAPSINMAAIMGRTVYCLIKVNTKLIDRVCLGAGGGGGVCIQPLNYIV